VAAAHQVSIAERPRAMAERLASAARREGLAATDIAHITRVYNRIIDHRAAFLPHDRYGDELHPGRSAVILLDDVGTPPAAAVVVAIVLDSEHPDWMLAEDEVRELAGGDAAALLDELPAPADDAEHGLETLLAASTGARLAAVAERLDHARHLHLRPPGEWRAFHESIERVYAPIATRTNAMLEYRLARWSGMFRDRYLRS
jgi:hypothetical protein